MNSNGRASIVSAVAVAVLLATGFLAIRFIPPSPRFVVGRPEVFPEGEPVFRGSDGQRALIVRIGGRIIALQPTCPPPQVSPPHPGYCVVDWNPNEHRFICPCDRRFTYEREGKSTIHEQYSLWRFRVTLAPNGEVMVDRSVTFAEKDWLKPGADLFLVPPVQSGQGM